MTHQIVLQSPGRRAAAYWFVDGLPEIGFGVVYLLWSVAGLVWGFDPKNWWLKWAVALAGVVFLVLFIWDRRIIEFFKARLTYPRTGYVRPPSEPRVQPEGPAPFLQQTVPMDQNVTTFRTRTVLVFFVAKQLVQMTATLGNGEVKLWAVPLFTAIAAGLNYWWTRQEPRTYPWWSFVLIASAGVASLALDVPGNSRQFIPLLIGGVWLLTNGASTLYRYLRENAA